MQAAASWYPDPTQRFEYRYWDGRAWTDHVSTEGRITRDPDGFPGPTSQPSTRTGSVGSQRSLWTIFYWVAGGVGLLTAGLVIGRGQGDAAAAGSENGAMLFDALFAFVVNGAFWGGVVVGVIALVRKARER